jgi:hypothetical protein
MICECLLAAKNQRSTASQYSGCASYATRYKNLFSKPEYIKSLELADLNQSPSFIRSFLRQRSRSFSDLAALSSVNGTEGAVF